MTLNLPARDAWAKAQDPGDPTNWVVLSYAEGSKTDLTAASGTGGLAEFCAALQNDAIHYGGVVVYGVDGRGNITSRREKFVQITWIGANVGVMAKSKVAGQRSKAMAYFSGYHIAYQIMDGDRDDISGAELEKKLLQVGGAHTPEYYDFGGGASGAAAGADAREKEAAGGGVDAAEVDGVVLERRAELGEAARAGRDGEVGLRALRVGEDHPVRRVVRVLGLGPRVSGGEVEGHGVDVWGCL